MNAALAVDGGQTGLRMALVRNGIADEITRAGGFAYASGMDVVDTVVTAVAEAYDALGAPPEIERVCLGLSSAPMELDRRRSLADAVLLRLGAAEVMLSGDMVTSHAGALGGQAGVVTAAGTGVVVLGIGPGGAHQGDGHGYLLGDHGSGFAVGRAALQAVMDARDGRGAATALVEAAADAMGDLDGLSQRVYTSPAPVTLVASCTSWVARVARAGDPVAAGIWAGAVDDLVRTTSTVVARAFPDAEPGSVPVSYAGGLFAIDDLVLAPFTELLVRRCPAARLLAPLATSLDGAVRLLADGLGPYAPLIVTSRSDAHA